jgi:hypothetical protein
MVFLARLLGIGTKATTQTTTSDRPFVIRDPAIGFLNLDGDRALALLEADRAAFAPLFSACHTSSGDVPKCQVLVVYGDINTDGRIGLNNRSLRELAKSAGAYLAVIASETNSDRFSALFADRNDWNANIVIVVERRGTNFANFFQRLFAAMNDGKSMLVAWVEIAPQIPGYDDPNGPDCGMLAEAGHITFARIGSQTVR